MIAVTLAHIAILTNFAVAHAAGTQFDIHAIIALAAPSQAHVQDWREHDKTCEPVPTVEKGVVRETTFSEMYSLDIETIARPDKEIVALQKNAHHLKSALGNFQCLPKTTLEAPNAPYFRTDWVAQFALRWDDDGGYWLGGKYVPPEQARTWGEIMAMDISNHGH